MFWEENNELEQEQSILEDDKPQLQQSLKMRPHSKPLTLSQQAAQRIYKKSVGLSRGGDEGIYFYD